MLFYIALQLLHDNNVLQLPTVRVCLIHLSVCFHYEEDNWANHSQIIHYHPYKYISICFSYTQWILYGLIAYVQTAYLIKRTNNTIKLNT